MGAPPTQSAGFAATLAAAEGHWPSAVLRATGVSAPGIAPDDAAVASAIQLKFEYYTNPAAHGIADISAEGRMFLDAVDRGYVPKTPGGLMTMLVWNDMGNVNQSGLPTGRPAEISSFFREWSARAAATPPICP
ncbi:MAG: hypothetical protein HOP28_09115 [Gemmatimonadales bacterium]|nr:hypothetical protein [Gemmatimonadales bacterium]